MQLIITSFENNYLLFSELKIKYKFFNYNTLLNKLIKKYLHESRILFIYTKNDNQEYINNIINLVKNYEKEIILFMFDYEKFVINKYSIFILNEFMNSNLNIKNFKKFFPENYNSISFPKIYYNKIINNNIIITGICRDISKYIYTSLSKILYLSIYFKNIKIIIYENDSIDDTLSILLDFQNKFHSFDIKILFEKNIKGDRIEKISHARNFILNYIYSKKLNPDYIINIDLDEIMQKFKCHSIIYPFKENIEWSMFGGNSKIYYDMWALRTLKNPNTDFWYKKKNDEGKYLIPINEIIKFYFKIDPNSSPIPVHSCFNGIGIYKFKHIKNCFYNGKYTCEHVDFHNKMIKYYNAKIYIHPKLIVGPHKILGKSMDFFNINKLVKNIL